MRYPDKGQNLPWQQNLRETMAASCFQAGAETLVRAHRHTASALNFENARLKIKRLYFNEIGTGERLQRDWMGRQRFISQVEPGPHPVEYLPFPRAIRAFF